MNRPLLVGASAVVGLFTGLLANGGGFLLVPLYVLVFGLSMRQAVGTSLVVVAALTVPTLAVHWSLGHIDWAVAGLFASGALPASAIASVLARRVDAVMLQRLRMVPRRLRPAFHHRPPDGPLLRQRRRSRSPGMRAIALPTEPHMGTSRTVDPFPHAVHEGGSSARSFRGELAEPIAGRSLGQHADEVLDPGALALDQAVAHGLLDGRRREPERRVTVAQ